MAQRGHGIIFRETLLAFVSRFISLFEGEHKVKVCSLIRIRLTCERFWAGLALRALDKHLALKVIAVIGKALV